MLASIAVAVWGCCLYIVLCGLTLLTGRGIQRCLRIPLLGTHALLSPLLAFVGVSLAAGLLGVLRVPFKTCAPWAWLAITGLAAIGLRRPWPSLRGFNLLLLAAVLPLVTMRRHFLHGITEYLGSNAPDGWSYIAFAQFIWEYPRQMSTGLAPLYQYGSHLSETRYVSSALLGLLSPLVSVGDMQPVSGLLQAWALFILGCAVALFWRADGRGLGFTALATALTVACGWMANLVWANNYDNGLAVVYMPLIAGVVLLNEARGWRCWALVGAAVATLLYTYIELSAPIVGGALLVTLPCLWRVRRNWRALVAGVLVVGCTVVVLVLPVLLVLATFLQAQLAIAMTGSARPGEGFFTGLIDPQFWPSAFWGLGGEYRIVPYADLRNLLAYVLTAVVAAGLLVLLKQRRWGVVAAALLFSAGALWIMFVQRYGYGSYKIILIAWWLFAGVVAAAIEFFALGARPRAVRYPSLVASLLLGIALLSQFNHATPALGAQYFPSVNAARPASEFRVLEALAPIVRGAPVLVSVDDWLANEWAVYYLRDTPTIISDYRMYMAQPHLIRFMDAATPIAVSAVQYVLTDVSDTSLALQHAGWAPIWSGGAYRLWKVPATPWTILTKLNNPNGIEQGGDNSFFWMGKGDTMLEVLASQAGQLSIAANFVAGPSVPGQPERRLMIGTDRGYSRQVTLKQGLATLHLPVEAGKNKIVLAPLDWPTIAKQPNGDTRALVVGVQGLRVGFPGQLAEQTTLVEQIDNPNGLEQLDGLPFFWMGSSATTLTIVSLQAGTAELSANFILGPSLPNVAERHVQVAYGDGYREVFVLSGGKYSLAIPIVAGKTTISLLVLDKPSQAALSNGDKRVLLLGVQDLNIRLMARQ